MQGRDHCDKVRSHILTTLDTPCCAVCRSLLANPRIGAAIIATPAKPQREDESLYADVHEPVQSWAHAQGGCGSRGHV